MTFVCNTSVELSQKLNPFLSLMLLNVLDVMNEMTQSVNIAS